MVKYYQPKFNWALVQYFIAGNQKCQNPAQSFCMYLLRGDNGQKIEGQVTLMVHRVLTPTPMQTNTKTPAKLD